jgi:hypothetical protein
MIECEYPGCDRLATSTKVNADGYLVASSPPTCREHEGSIAPTDDSAERTLTEKLVSPNGFNGHGPVPEKVTQAAKRIAGLRTKFIHQWTPGMGQPLTTREVEELFDASAIQAEWMRELYEAVHDDT